MASDDPGKSSLTPLEKLSQSFGIGCMKRAHHLLGDSHCGQSGVGQTRTARFSCKNRRKHAGCPQFASLRSLRRLATHPNLPPTALFRFMLRSDFTKQPASEHRQKMTRLEKDFQGGESSATHRSHIKPSIRHGSSIRGHKEPLARHYAPGSGTEIRESQDGTVFTV